MTLNEKIGIILRQHPGGEPFFNALDFLVRSDIDILNQFLKYMIDNVQTRHIILTGSFGRALLNNFGKILYDHFSTVILVEGGLRGRTPAPELFINKKLVNTEGGSDFTLVDDSFYSGTTRNKIEAALMNVDASFVITSSIVVYDGSPQRNPYVLSLYRYHE